MTGAKLVVGNELLEGGIAIENGKIVKIGRDHHLPKADLTIDAEGCVALPGLIDVHVHLRDLELSYKEDFFTGTCAAAAGGFTTVIDMPNTIPPTNSAERIRAKAQAARKKIIVNVGFFGALSTDRDETERMARAGAVAFKLNLHKPIGNIEIGDDTTLQRCISQAAEQGKVVAIHAEDGLLIQRLQSRLASKGKSGLEDFAKAHPPRAELGAVARFLRVAEHTRGRVHLCHLSLSRSVELMRKSLKEGLCVSCEVTPHHMFLTNATVREKGATAVVAPPLRTRNEARELRRAFRNGSIDIVASDHAPHGLLEKQMDDAWSVATGMPGLETTLPLLLTQVNRGETNLQRIADALARRPAEVFNLRGKGSLAVGSDGDITLVDLRAKHRIDSSKFHSKAKFSPFDKVQCKGRPVKTIVSGRLVMDHGEILGQPGFGSVIGASYAWD